MSDDPHQRWISRSNQTGIFDEFSIRGVRYEATNGDLAWYIETSFPIRTYWVERGEFYSIGIHALDTISNYRVEKLGVDKELGKEEKEAVLRAIGEWEKHNN